MHGFKALCLLFLASLLTIASSSFSQITDPGSSKISVKELATITVKDLINAGENAGVVNSTISFDDDENDIIEFTITEGKEPQYLRRHLTRIKPGQYIYIENRLAYAGGKYKKTSNTGLPGNGVRKPPMIIHRITLRFFSPVKGSSPG